MVKIRVHDNQNLSPGILYPLSNGMGEPGFSSTQKDSHAKIVKEQDGPVRPIKTLVIHDNDLIAIISKLLMDTVDEGNDIIPFISSRKNDGYRRNRGHGSLRRLIS